MCRPLDSLVDVSIVESFVFQRLSYWSFIWQNIVCDVVSCSLQRSLLWSMCWEVLVRGSVWDIQISILLFLLYSILQRAGQFLTIIVDLAYLQCWFVQCFFFFCVCVLEWKKNPHLSFFLFIYTYSQIHALSSECLLHCTVMQNC